MNLDDAQTKKVAGWITEGLNLADIQKRLGSELGISLTYMEVRLLVDDLKLTPKDPERLRTVELGTQAPADGASPGQEEPPGVGEPPGTIPEADASDRVGGNVAVTVDALARPGAVVSGKVTFSDGKSAEWHLDQMGRLGLVPKEKGYKPAAADIQMFQMQLQNELAKIGF